MSLTNAWRQLRFFWLTGDLLATLVAYFVADVARTKLYLRTSWPEVLPGFHSAFEVHYWTLVILPIAWPALLSLVGWYAPRWRRPGWFVLRALAASIVIALFLAGLALFFRRDAFPRMQVVLFGLVLPATTLLGRGISGWLGRRQLARRDRHVLIVGTGRDAVRLRRLLRASALGRSTVVGHLVTADEPAAARNTGAVLGSLDRLAELLDRQVVDEVYFALPLERLASVLSAVRHCEEVGVIAHVLAESPLCHTRPAVEDFHGLPMLAYARTRHSAEALLVKRLMDVAFSALAIVGFGPVMLLCALLIRSTGPGPVLYRQQRVGLNGRLFRMLKFRTMTPDAEQRLGEVAHLNEATGPVFKARRDPRITRIGAWLRKYSLDELPQFFNVLRGDMSLVGPRPPIPEEVAEYDRWQRRRLSMRPGLTCLWQVRGRHRIPFDEWMRLDLQYIDHWSLGLDIRILARTVLTVLAGTGA